jgi:hypothetical protein
VGTDTAAEPDPRPLLMDEMRHILAGALTFGVIAREFTEESMSRYTGHPGIDELLRRIREDGFWDGGLSVYVFGTGDLKRDLLRFDCFAVEPHYHYQYVGLTSDDIPEHQRIAGRAESVVRQGRWYQIPFDPAANGDMFEWTMTRLRNRLPEMLREAGADDLAAAVDPVLVGPAVDAIEALFRATYPSGSLDRGPG